MLLESLDLSPSNIYMYELDLGLFPFLLRFILGLNFLSSNSMML
jgi:hypothetical protein